MKEIKKIIKNTLTVISFIALCVISFVMIAFFFSIMFVPIIGSTIILVPCLFYFFKVKCKFRKSEILKHKYASIYLMVLMVATLYGFYILYRFGTIAV
jgi:hypothetical protein